MLFLFKSCSWIQTNSSSYQTTFTRVFGGTKSIQRPFEGRRHLIPSSVRKHDEIYPWSTFYLQYLYSHVMWHALSLNQIVWGNKIHQLDPWRGKRCLPPPPPIIETWRKKTHYPSLIHPGSLFTSIMKRFTLNHVFWKNSFILSLLEGKKPTNKHCALKSLNWALLTYSFRLA